MFGDGMVTGGAGEDEGRKKIRRVADPRAGESRAASSRRHGEQRPKRPEKTLAYQ